MCRLKIEFQLGDNLLVFVSAFVHTFLCIYIYIYLRQILIQAKELGPRRGIVTLPQMHAFGLVVGCIFYLECFFSAFPALADNMDLKQLFAGSEPTKPNGHNVGASN